VIVREQTVRFDGNRMPLPRTVRVGYESDHLAERLIFELPQADVERSVFLVLAGEYADVVLTERDADGRCFVDLTANMLGDGGTSDCWVQVRYADGTVWNSGVLKMRVGELPDADGDLMDREPTIVEQVTQAVERLERETVERLCPAFEESGAAVVCHPVAGSALGVVSGIEAVQEGSGNASPDNVRLISGYEEAVLSVNDTAYETQFGRTVYGGTYDWSRGVLTVTHGVLVLTGEESFSVSGKVYYHAHSGGSGALENGACSHFRCETGAAYNTRYPDSVEVRAARLWVYAARFETAAELKAYLAAQYAAGTPVTVVYPLTEPYEVQLTGTVIAAAEGENVITSSTGGTSVSGRSDPAWMIGNLAARVAALEAAVVNGN